MPNPYRDMLQLITQYALEMEMNAHLGAEAYERSENRKGKVRPQAACVHHQGRGPRTVGLSKTADGTFSTVLFERFRKKRKSAVLNPHGDVHPGRLHSEGEEYYRRTVRQIILPPDGIQPHRTPGAGGR